MNVYDVNNIALYSNTDAMHWTYHYQTFLQRLQNIDNTANMHYIQLHLQNQMRADNDWMAGRI